MTAKSEIVTDPVGGVGYPKSQPSAETEATSESTGSERFETNPPPTSVETNPPPTSVKDDVEAVIDQWRRELNQFRYGGRPSDELKRVQGRAQELLRGLDCESLDALVLHALLGASESIAARWTGNLQALDAGNEKVLKLVEHLRENEKLFDPRALAQAYAWYGNALTRRAYLTRKGDHQNHAVGVLKDALRLLEKTDDVGRLLHARVLRDLGDAHIGQLLFSKEVYVQGLSRLRLQESDELFGELLQEARNAGDIGLARELEIEQCAARASLSVACMLLLELRRQRSERKPTICPLFEGEISVDRLLVQGERRALRVWHIYRKAKESGSVPFRWARILSLVGVAGHLIWREWQRRSVQQEMAEELRQRAEAAIRESITLYDETHQPYRLGFVHQVLGDAHRDWLVRCVEPETREVLAKEALARYQEAARLFAVCGARERVRECDAKRAWVLDALDHADDNDALPGWLFDYVAWHENRGSREWVEEQLRDVAPWVSETTSLRAKLCQLRMGKTDQLRDEVVGLKAAVQQSPESARPCINLANVLCALGLVDGPRVLAEARGTFEQAELRADGVRRGVALARNGQGVTHGWCAHYLYGAGSGGWEDEVDQAVKLLEESSALWDEGSLEWYQSHFNIAFILALKAENGSREAAQAVLEHLEAVRRGAEQDPFIASVFPSVAARIERAHALLESIELDESAKNPVRKLVTLAEGGIRKIDKEPDAEKELRPRVDFEEVRAASSAEGEFTLDQAVDDLLREPEDHHMVAFQRELEAMQNPKYRQWVDKKAWAKWMGTALTRAGMKIMVDGDADDLGVIRSDKKGTLYVQTTKREWVGFGGSKLSIVPDPKSRLGAKPGPRNPVESDDGFAPE